MKQETTHIKEGLHTQGEWNNNLHDGNVYGSNGIVIANCYSSLLSPATIKANAELIVKAVNNHKKLLNALDQAKADLYNLSNGINGKRSLREMFADIDTIVNNCK